MKAKQVLTNLVIRLETQLEHTEAHLEYTRKALDKQFRENVEDSANHLSEVGALNDEIEDLRRDNLLLSAQMENYNLHIQELRKLAQHLEGSDMPEDIQAIVVDWLP